MSSFGFFYLGALALAITGFVLFVARGGGAAWRLDVRDGELTVRRGKPPRRLLDDFGDALRHVGKAKILGKRVDGRIELSFSGDIDDGTAQRLRNILGIHQR